MSTTNTTTVTDDGRIVSEKISAILDGTATSTRNNRRGGEMVNPLNQQKLSPSEQNLIPQPQSRGGSTRGGSAGTQMPSTIPMPPAPPTNMQFNF